MTKTKDNITKTLEILLQRETPEQFDQKITIALAYTNGNLTKAARLLGISTSTMNRHVARRRKDY